MNRCWHSLGVAIAMPLLLVVLIMITMQSTGAHTGGDITVCPSGCDYTTIMGAVDAALDNDVILLAAGTYTEYITIDKLITLQGAGSASTIVNGDGSSRVFYVTVDGNATIMDLAIINGRSHQGSGVLNLGALMLDSVVITGNVATGASFPPYAGGGISNHGSMFVYRTTIVNNEAPFGGGIWNEGIFYLADSVVDGNLSHYDDGGGIYNCFSGLMELNKSTVSHNEALNGGGIYNGAELELNSSTISDNYAFGQGGGIYNGKTLRLTNCTIAGNSSASKGGGIISKSTGTVQLLNTILAGNSTNESGADCSGTLNSKDFNLIQDPANCTIGGTTVHNITGKDSLLRPLGNYGGPTPTMALSAGSPAIDAGTNSGCPAKDQRGQVRPVDGNNDSIAICDIGAYEYAWDIVINGATNGIIGSSYTFIVQVIPPTAYPPITYTWQVSEKSPITTTAGLSDAQSFSWDMIGEKICIVSARNDDGLMATAVHTIKILQPYSFLPLVLR
ncbi:MAG: hypothetical protein JXA42_20010 [Anaerolineales bacterium]|nr:hypothetical protein [Anaerolineales bacterium]